MSSGDDDDEEHGGHRDHDGEDDSGCVETASSSGSEVQMMWAGQCVKLCLLG